MAKKKSESIRDKAIKLFEKRGGMLRTSEAIALGIHPRILYELYTSGIIIQIQRGLYALANLADVEAPDLITVTKKVPKGVICLISALYFHHLTLQIPKWIDVAIPQTYKPPIINNPPTRFHWFSGAFYRSQIKVHEFHGVKVKIYSAEKTIIDCFRLRKKISLSITLEALKMYLMRPKKNLKLLRIIAKQSRVTHVIDPYLEALTHDQS